MIELLLLINSLREIPLELSEDLNVRAEIRAIEVDKNFSHDNYSRVFANSGCWQYGENLVEGYSTNRQRFNALANSPTHLANMVNPKYNKIGIGYYGNKIAILFCEIRP